MRSLLSWRRGHDSPGVGQRALIAGGARSGLSCLTLALKSSFIFFQIEVCILKIFSARKSKF